MESLGRKRERWLPKGRLGGRETKLKINDVTVYVLV